ncbi:MAG: FAD-dependent monooxygenase [Pseudomonadota bacterium]
MNGNSQTNTTHDCVIVGAGLGGLAFALTRARFGQPSLVLESAAQLGEVGAGISLPPNALKILWRLGLQEALAGAISVPDHGEIRRGDTGRLLAEIPFGAPLVERYGAPFAQIHRADLHRCLLDAALATNLVDIRTSHAVASAEPGDSSVTVRTSSGNQLEARAVIGSDGIRSTLRESHFNQTPARFTRHVAWRCLIPMERLPETLHGPRSIVNVMDHRMLVHYPVRHGTLLNCAAFVGEMDWSVESWHEPGDVAELHSYFAAFRDDCQHVLAAIPADACHRWAIYDREPIVNWATDRIALLGDAAHPMPPYMGQGAAMAIEDAFVLATAMNAHDNLREAFAEYQHHRTERANTTLEESRAAGRRFQEPGADTDRFDNDQALRSERMFAYEPTSPLVCH